MGGLCYERVITSYQKYPFFQFELTSDRIVWSEMTRTLPYRTALLSVPKSGGTISELSDFDGGSLAFGLGGGKVYWATCEGSLFASSVDTGPAKALDPFVSFCPFGEPVVDDTNVFYVRDGNGAGLGTILRMPREGGVPTTVIAGQTHPAELHLLNGTLYWWAAGGIWKGSAYGPVDATKLVGSASTFTPYADWIYYVDDNRDLWRLPTAGGQPESMAVRSIDTINRIVVDGDRLFAFSWSPGSSAAYLHLPDRRWVSLRANAQLVAVDATYVYVADGVRGLFRLPKDRLPQ